MLAANWIAIWLPLIYIKIDGNWIGLSDDMLLLNYFCGVDVYAETDFIGIDLWMKVQVNMYKNWNQHKWL